MTILHEKSPCHGAPVQRYGGRRRRCTLCGHTWSVHPRTRGRNRRRLDTELPRQLLNDREPARTLSRRRHCSVSTLYRRARLAFDYCRRLPDEPPLAQEQDLVLLVDGLHFSFSEQRWTLYDMALKSAHEQRAWFLDPVMLQGPESILAWEQALSNIPTAIFLRIRALVADGFRGMKELAHSYGWVYQRCHYHIWAQLRMWMDIGRRDEGMADLRRAIRTVLLARDEDLAEQAGCMLAAEVRYHPGPMSDILRQILRDWRAVRAYWHYPQYGIPRTTSTVESMHNLIRQAVVKTSTPRAVARRANALIRVHGPVKCTAPVSQQN